MKVLTLPNEILIPQVCKVLKEGQEAVLGVRGNSMNPFIDGDRDSVVLKKERNYVPGDIVLAMVGEGKYVIHRIVEQKPDGTVVLMGDGNLQGREYCFADSISGRAIEVVRPSGRHDSLVSPKALRRAALWKRLLPVRRYLLAFYRHIILKLK